MPLPPTPNLPNEPAAVYLSPHTLHAWPGNPRVEHDVAGIARSIARLGFGAPILARPDGEVIAGHGRLAAALQLGLALVPVRIMALLDDDEAHALALADNAYTDASHNDDALYREAMDGLPEDLRAALDMPEPELPADDSDTTMSAPGAAPFTTEEIVNDAFAYFRAHGFPWPATTVHEAKQAINALALSDELATSQLASQVADAWCPHRLATRVSSGGGFRKSPVDGFAEDSLLRHALAFDLGANKRVGIKYFGGLNLAHGVQACANFRPGFAAWLYRRFCKVGDRVLDTSHGFGGRLVGFIAAGVPAHYIGIDPCTATSEGVGRMARDLGVAARCTFIRKPAEDVTPEEIGQVQFAFTSPPYWDREHYSDEPNNSCNRYGDSTAWREGFLRPILALQWACLAPGSRAVLNIAPISNGKSVVPLDAWTIDDAQAIGFRLSHVETFRMPAMPGEGHEGGETNTEPVIVLVRP